MQSKRLLKAKWIDLALVAILTLVSGFLVFYNLGNLSLHPWDEAWYATISRNVVYSPNILDLRYNTNPFWDHPPLGFYLTASSFILFGVNELGARAPQALLGIATIVTTYLIGKRLKNRWTGLIAALIVLSSRWFLFRARTGNLDILLAFTQLTFFWAALSTQQHRKLWLPALGLSFALLSKTTISITLTPLLLWSWYERHQLQKIKLDEVVVAVLAFLGPLLPWYGYNSAAYGLKFLKRSIFEVGLRSGSASGVALASVKQTALYFHSAVHRWYSFMGLSAILSAAIWLWHFSKRRFSQVRNLSWLLAYIFLVGFPYLLSAKTEIWHLIPLIAPMALLTGLIGSAFAEKIPKVGYPLLLGATIFIAASSIRSYWTEFIGLAQSTSEAAQLSKTISDKNQRLYLTNDAFYPTIVYYSDLEAEVLVVKEYEFGEICSSSLEPFYYISTQSFLDQAQGWKKIGDQGELQLVEFDPSHCGPKDWPKPTSN